MATAAQTQGYLGGIEIGKPHQGAGLLAAFDIHDSGWIVVEAAVEQLACLVVSVVASKQHARQAAG
jgi:hypothetical protein